MSDVDQTVRDAKATIEKLDAMLRDSQEILAQGERTMSDLGIQPGTAQAYASRQPADQQAEFARQVQAIHDEIERDVPKQTATRPMKLKPARQIV